MSTVPPSDHTSEYLKATLEADADVRSALQAVSDEEDEGRISPAQASAERVQLLERHLQRCHELRVRYLGDAP